MTIRGKAWSWNATEHDWWAWYPCDRYIEPPFRELIRVVEVEAPTDVVFRWVCQMKVAPYSYDWIDNLGRRSPRELTPGADRLEVGQNFGIGPIVAFAKDHHITGVAHPRVRRFLGNWSYTYLVEPTGPCSCRLVVKANTPCRGWWGRLRAFLLAWCDLVMMRKQLLTFKELAEKTVRETGVTGPLEAGLGRDAA